MTVVNLSDFQDTPEHDHIQHTMLNLFSTGTDVAMKPWTPDYLPHIRGIATEILKVADQR